MRSAELAPESHAHIPTRRKAKAKARKAKARVEARARIRGKAKVKVKGKWRDQSPKGKGKGKYKNKGKWRSPSPWCSDSWQGNDDKWKSQDWNDGGWQQKEKWRESSPKGKDKATGKENGRYGSPSPPKLAKCKFWDKESCKASKHCKYDHPDDCMQSSRGTAKEETSAGGATTTRRVTRPQPPQVVHQAQNRDRKKRDEAEEKAEGETKRQKASFRHGWNRVNRNHGYRDSVPVHS